MAKATLAALIAIIMCIAPVLAIFGQTIAQVSTDNWPMFRYNAAHSGALTSVGIVSPVLLWNFSEGHFDGYFTGSSAAVVNGIVYVGSNERSYEKAGGNIYALDAYTGEKIWNYSTGNTIYDAIHSSPAIYENKLYIGAGKNVLALDALTGHKIWSFETGQKVDSSPAVVDGTVFIGSGDGNVYALDALTGAKIWNFTTAADVISSPAVVAGVVYVASCDGNLYALNATTGAEVWTYRIGGQVISSPVIVDDVLYIGGGYLFALNASDGTLVWRFETIRRYNDGITVTPAVADGKVYVCTNLALQAVNSVTGTEIWSNSTFAFKSSPTVANGVLYIANYAFNAKTGTEIWHFHTGNQINASPVIVNGVLYIASQDGHLYAIGEPIVTPLPTPNIDSDSQTFWMELSFSAIIIVSVIGLIIYWAKLKILKAAKSR
jgi:eukaryotic-like serine/threonine-protein kinase